MTKFDFEIGQSVYLKTDKEELERIITGISVRANGHSYELAQGTSSSWHFPFEIKKDKNEKTHIGIKRH